MSGCSPWYENWSVNFLDNNDPIRTACLNTGQMSQYKRFPIRLLRYWFMYQLLREEMRRKGSLRVCEIGVHRGQMKHFFNAAYKFEEGEEIAQPLIGWDAIDVNLDESSLATAGYQELYSMDLESDSIPAELSKQYDVIILLHVLEHLHEPEDVVQRLLPIVKQGGLVIGGMPGLPNCLLQWQQARLRKKAAPFGHVSAFSVNRIAKIADQNNAYLEFCRGAFMFRSKHSFLENYDWWMRFNLAFGACFPTWPGELYWSLRLPNFPPPNLEQ